MESYLNSLSKPSSPYIFAFGDLHANGATNVIPEKALAKGTLRTMDEDWRKLIHIKLQDFVSDFLKTKDATGELKILKGYPFLENNVSLTQDAFQVSQAFLGKQNVEKMDMRMTAEDFSYYSQEIPACFFRLGVRNEALGIVHGVHHPKFNIDNNALAIGAGTLASIAIQTLRKK